MSRVNPLVVMTALTACLVGTSFVAEAVGEETAQNVPPVTTTIVSEPTTTLAKVVPADVSEPAVRVTPPVITVPPPPVWSGNIPEHYGEGSGCDVDQASLVAVAMWNEGAFDADVEWMLGVISRESTCDSSAYNGNRNTGDDSWGICQLNVLAGFFKSGHILDGYDYTAFSIDFELNARACARLWAVCGRGPWIRGDYGCREPEKQTIQEVVEDSHLKQ